MSYSRVWLFPPKINMVLVKELREQNGKTRVVFYNEYSDSKNRRNLGKMTWKCHEPVRGYFNNP